MRVLCIVLGTLIAGWILPACDGGQDSGWSTDIRDAENPLGQRTLRELDEAQIIATLDVTRQNINAARPAGIQQLIDELKIELTGRGIDATPIDGIADDDIGGAMPGGTVAAPPTGGGNTGGGNASPPANLEVTKYYDCPILAPEQNEGTSCDKLVSAALARVKAKIAQDQSKTRQDVDASNGSLPQEGKEFVAAWTDAASEHGAEVAATYAQYELRASARCDSKANAKVVAESLGREQGWSIVLSHRAWALSQVTSCVVNTDAIAEQVRVMAKAEIDSFMKGNPVCEDADISSANTVLADSEKTRKDGITKGIDQRVEVLRTELFQARAQVPCPPAGGGDPLVIDLDGDGVRVLPRPVAFDLLANGNRQRVSWPASGDGLLALDLDGNGRIDSGSELFGDRSTCDPGACYDGVAALRAYDSPERGGNGDGVIDGRDTVFSRLQVWVDANGDAVSQPGELSSAEARGIRAINLLSRELMSRIQGATIASELSVLMDDGFIKAYDVWLEMRIGAEDLGSFLPRR